jgi:transposase InsO family protein
MSKARLVITALVVEKQSPAAVAHRYGVHRSWVYRLKARYEAEGEAALTPRSRRPKTSPRATAPETVEAVLRLRKQLAEQGLDAGADTIRHHRLAPDPPPRRHSVPGDDRPGPGPARRGHPRARETPQELLHPVRSRPTERVLAVGFHPLPAHPPGRPPRRRREDHHLARRPLPLRLQVSAHRRVTARIVADTFTLAATEHGYPASTLTDNGMVYTVRLASRRGGRTALETELRRHGIAQKNSRPNHPTTCGKVERFQQTMKNWLAAQPRQPATIPALQALLDTFVEIYNHQRPHRSLPHKATPATTYQARPKATPTIGARAADSHDRVRTDKIDKTGCVTLRVAGKLRHIGIGRPHAGTHVLLLVSDLHVRVINAATGDLLRELNIDSTRDYQPRRSRHPETTTAEPTKR